MEDFNQKIKDKITSFEYADEVSDKSIAGFFEKLDSQKLQVDKVVPIVQLKTRSTFIGLKIAASIVVLLTASFGIFHLNDVSVIVEKGLTKVVELPDGSVAQLNADSKLHYNRLSWMVERNVSLEGEGFFKVQKGEKFTVVSDIGSTQVLGTSFNVFARANRYKVTCITGKVAVNSLLLDEIIKLTPGKGIEIQKNQQVIKFELDNNKAKDWRKGEFYFENVALMEVLNTLARQYNIEIKVGSNVENQRYTGYFDNKDLNKSLKLICEPIDLNFNIQGNTVEIK